MRLRGAGGKEPAPQSSAVPGSENVPLTAAAMATWYSTMAVTSLNPYGERCPPDFTDPAQRARRIARCGIPASSNSGPYAAYPSRS